jgi:hypothetical protein
MLTDFTASAAEASRKAVYMYRASESLPHLTRHDEVSLKSVLAARWKRYIKEVKVSDRAVDVRCRDQCADVSRTMATSRMRLNGGQVRQIGNVVGAQIGRGTTQFGQQAARQFGFAVQNAAPQTALWTPGRRVSWLRWEKGWRA